MKLLNFKASNLFSLGEVEINLDKRGLLLITGNSNDEGGQNGCVDKDTEFLSPNGWKYISEYKNEKVLQFDPVSGKADFVNPISYIKLPCTNFNSIQSKYGINQVLSDEHTVLYISQKTNKYKTITAKELVAKHTFNRYGFRGYFPTTYTLNNIKTSLPLSEWELRLQIAVIADGYFPNNTNRCRVNIKKQYKKDRLLDILNKLQIPVAIRQYTPKDLQFNTYFFDAPLKDKYFDEKYYACSFEQLQIVCDEIFRWDGDITKQIYRTTIKSSADFIQYALHAIGYRASIIVSKERPNKPIEYIVTVTKSKTPTLSYKSRITTTSSIDGYKYCFKVPSGFLVLRRRNDIFITGNSGKSSLSSKGIVWTLYGSTAAGDKADAVINRFADENATCSGSIDVECGNGGRFRIIRSRRPNRLTIVDLASGADVSCKTERDTQAMVDRLLGRSRETFLQTDFFGQGKAANFLDLTPKAQAELLETILPFEALTKLADDAKGFLVKLKPVLASEERQVSEHNGKMLEAQRQERELSASIDLWETNHAAKIESLTKDIANLTDNDSVVAKIGELKRLVISLPTRDETSLLEREARASLMALEEQRASYSSALAEWRGVAAKKLVKPVNNTCPTCAQTISEGKFNALLEAYECASMEVVSAAKTVDAYTEELTKLTDAIAVERSKLATAAQNTVKRDKVDADIAKLDATRNSDKLAILRQNLEAELLESNPFEHLYSNNASTLKAVMNSLGHHKARLAEVENDRKALEFWQAAFGKEIKNEFLNQICPFLEARANLHLGGMGNGQIKIKVSTTKMLQSTAQKSEFHIEVTSATGSNTYDGLSGGEKQIVNFATGLALADLAELQATGQSYVTILDEPMFALDDRNSENFINYLQSFLLKKKDTVLLVSNEESLKRLVPDQIKVIKQNGVTSLET